MSEKLPTRDQLNNSYTDICAKVGVLDFEMRQLLERRASIDTRLEEIERQKQQHEEIVARLNVTMKAVEAAEAEEATKYEEADLDAAEEAVMVGGDVGEENERTGD